VLIFSSS